MKTLPTVALAVVTASTAAGCGTSQPEGETVTYEVVGPTSASITYSDGTGQTSQETAASVPWGTDIAMSAGASSYRLSAQHRGGSDIYISCIIRVDGEVVTENTSNGPGAVVTCQYEP